MNKLNSIIYKIINTFNFKQIQRNEPDYISSEKHILQLNRLYATLSQINQTIVKVHDRNILFREICNIAVNYGGFRMAWIGLIDDTNRFVKPVAFAGEENNYLVNVNISLSDENRGKGPTGEAVREGHCVFCQDISNDPRMLPWSDEALKRGFRASAAVPIRQNDKVIGAFMVYAAQPMVFDVKEMQLLGEIGTDISFALNMIERENQRNIATAALQASEKKFRDVFESANVGKSITLPNGEINVNQAFCDMLGYTKEELKNTKWQDITPSDEVAYIQKILDQLLNGDKDSERFNKRYIHKNGSHIWANVNVKIHCNTNGKPVYFITTMIDITKQKLAEEKLLKSETQYRLLFGYMLEAMAYHKVIFENGRPVDYIYLSVNDAFTTHTGLKNVIGKKVSELVPGIRESNPELLERFGRVAITRIPEQYETFVKASNTWFYTSLYALSDEIVVSVFNNITEHKKAVQQLRDSEEKYRSVYENSSVAILLTSPDGGILSANKYACKVFDRTEDEICLIGRNGLVDISDTRLPLLLEERKKTGWVKGELTFIKKGGTKFPGELFSVVFTDSEGKERTSMVIRDLTEQKKAEELQRESEIRIRSVFEQANDGIFIISSENKYLDANQSGLELLGYTHDELLQMSVADVLAPHEVLRLEVELPRMMSGVPHLAEWEHIRKDGATFRGEVSARRLNNKSYMAIIRDLTMRRQAESTLRQSEERLRLSTELANVAVWEYDFMTNSMSRSKNHDRLYGLDWQNNWDINTFLDATHPDDREFSNTTIQKSVMPGGPDDYTFDFRVIFPDQSIRWLNVKGLVVMRNAHGQGIIVRGTLIDITDRKQIENELKLHHENLEKLVKERTAELEIEKEYAQSADRLKSIFLATMSHELRTPLNSIIGFAGILYQEYPGKLNAEQKKQLEMIRVSSRHLLSLINDILDLSKIEAGQLKVEFKPFNLAETIQKLVKTFKPLAEQKNLKVIVSLEPGIDEIVSDSFRVEQILINLINNAIKFTDTGRILITGLLAENEIIVKVTDTGIGIEKEKINEIFQPFIQADTGFTRKREGTGLGLSICKKLLTMLNGSIEVESELGTGSAFTIKLPLN